MEALTDDKVQILAEFQGIAPDLEVEDSIQLLKRCNWDLEVAVQTVFNANELAPRIAASQRHNIAPSVYNAHNPPMHHPVPEEISSTTVEPQRADPPPPPATGLTGLVGAGVNLLWGGVTGLTKFAWGLVTSLIPGGGPTPDAAAETTRFIEHYETQFGPGHPVFYQGSFKDALNHARGQGRLVLCYLHASNHESTAQFCRDVLGHPDVIGFINENFVCWGGEISAPQGHQLSNTLMASTYPFFGVVHSTSPTQNRVVDRIEGYHTPVLLQERFLAVLEHVANEGAASQRQREQRQIDRDIRAEQDSAYQAVLRADQEAERRAEEERSRKARAEAEARAKAEAERLQAEHEAEVQRLMEQQREEERATKLSMLKEEPPADARDVCKMIIRLPDGSRLERRFNATDRIEDVCTFVETHDGVPSEYDIMSNFPRRTYSNRQQTLREAELVPQGSVFVQERV